MAYFTQSTIADINALLTIIADQLFTAGWTEDAASLTGATPSIDYSSGPCFIKLSYNTVSGDGQLTLETALSFGSTTKKSVVVNALEGAYDAVHIFVTADYCHVVVQKTGGLHIHFSFGVHNKGTLTTDDTMYATGNFINKTTKNKLYANSMSLAHINNRALIIPSGVLNTAYAPSGDIATDVILESINLERLSYNSRNFPYVPTGVSKSYRMLDFFPRVGNSSYVAGNVVWQLPAVAYLSSNYHMLGASPDVRIVDVSTFASGDEFTNGNVTFKVFPIIRQGISSNLLDGTSPINDWNSLNLGLAYIK